VNARVQLPDDQPVVIIERTFDAPRELVWEAFTNPRHVAQWFGGTGFTSPACTMDVRPGGLWRHVLRAPNGFEFAIESIFLEVVPPERLSWKNATEVHGPGAPPAVTQTVTLREDGARTHWRLEARYRYLEDRATSVQMGFATMVTQGVERLADFLETQTQGGRQ
jgi:uncharacterized protein YndB with AHSA1/START domain